MLASTKLKCTPLKYTIYLHIRIYLTHEIHMFRSYEELECKIIIRIIDV